MNEASALQTHAICPARRVSPLHLPAEGLTFTFGLLRKDAQELGAQVSVIRVCSAEFEPLGQCLLSALRRTSWRADKPRGIWAGLTPPGPSQLLWFSERLGAGGAVTHPQWLLRGQATPCPLRWPWLQEPECQGPSNGSLNRRLSD